MSFNSGNEASGQEQTRHRTRCMDESSLKAPLLTSHPLLIAVFALGLVLVGFLLGAASSCLISRDHMKASQMLPLRGASPGSEKRNHHSPTKLRHTRSLLGRHPNMESLESIMYHYRTDKSKDDKKYSDLYAMLFDSIRMEVRNVTEIGMGDGGSMMTWHDYFRKADIYGIDRSLNSVENYLSGLPRVHLLQANPLKAKARALGLRPGSMDVVFESAGKGLIGQEEILPLMWPLVREGGYYVIEDVSFDRRADQRSYPLLHHPSDLPVEVRQILSKNDAFFADTTLGHRAFEEFISKQPKDLDRFSHSAHVIVIRKRTEPLRAVAINAHGSLPLAPTHGKAPLAPTPELPLSSYMKRQKKLLGL